MAATVDGLYSRPIDLVPMTFVDVETTGLSARTGDRICEIALVCYRGAEETDRFATLIDPQRPISLGASRVNGITDSMVRGQPRFAEIFARVRQILERGAVVVAHNAPFDLGFLEDEYRRAGLRFQAPVAIDTCVLARRTGRFASNSLPAVASALGVRAGGHRALGDVLATRAVFEHLVGTIGDPTVLTVSEVLSYQDGGPGATTPGIDGGWPTRATAAPVDAGLMVLIQTRAPVRLRYASTGGATSRIVQPFRVYAFSSVWYLEAYCHLRQEQRTFRLDRILEWEPHNGELPVPLS